MESLRLPSEEEFNGEDKEIQSQDRLDELYAAKAMERLDEVFRLQGLADEQLSGKTTEMINETPEIESVSEYEVEFGERYGNLRDPEVKEIDTLTDEQKKAFEETIQILRDNGIDPLDQDSELIA